MSSLEKLKKLVTRFDDHRDAYLSGQYNETQVRREFIDPFFKLLGWDIDNEQGYAEAYKDVIHEDSIKIGGATKAPDYCFRTGGTRKFFLEAKRPSVNIKEDISASFQLRRYGWSAKLPLSILTDFEEFAVYDCRIKPSQTDKVSKARIQYFQYTDYPEKWDEIASIYSRDAVLKGLFDKFVETTKTKKGTAEVDSAFLADIENWRETLAHNLSLRNSGLTSRQLNFSVQALIDRIIFLRMCEDRGIETYGRLQALQNGTQIYSRLCHQFREADDRYNSGLFHFKEEKGRATPPDDLTLSLTVDDKILKEIFKNLYFPDSPYEFSVLPTEILGEVYEQFLGKVIRIKGRSAVVEEKPEVKKAGGVYYTPRYIVDYIVQNTVGELLQGKKPGKRGGVDKIKILDPACGSGSFLLGAYQYLLDWYRDGYVKAGPEKHKKILYPMGKKDWRLTTDERKRILLTHIHGVDIDPQAVEVTKLSLLLKVLEGESDETLKSYMKLFHDRALPDLGSNIKCGNSLIGPDFYQGQQMSLLDEEEQYRINAFDWQTEFKDIMQSGGFDVVIGNPPYVFGRDWKGLNIGDDIKNHLGEKYKISPYQLDMFSIFMEKAFILCKLLGCIGQIVPNVWLTNSYSSITRSFVLKNSKDLVITNLPLNVFSGLTVDTIVYSLKKNTKPCQTFIINAMREKRVTEKTIYKTQLYLSGKLPISTALNSESAEFIYKLKNNNLELKDLANTTRGIHPYRTGGYGQSAFVQGVQIKKDVEERPYNSKKSMKGYRPFIYGRDLRRYARPEPSEFIKYGPWLAEPRQPSFFEGDRVYSRKILGKRLIVTLEKADSVADQQVYITKSKCNNLRSHFLVGIFGSKLISFFVRKFYDEVNDAFPQIKVGQLKSLPMPKIDFDNLSNKFQHDRMVELVERMLELNQKLAEAKTAQDKTHLQRQIDSTDKEIDRLVYDLYDLTEAEIALVEKENG